MKITGVVYKKKSTVLSNNGEKITGEIMSSSLGNDVNTKLSTYF